MTREISVYYLYKSMLNNHRNVLLDQLGIMLACQIRDVRCRDNSDPRHLFFERTFSTGTVKLKVLYNNVVFKHFLVIIEAIVFLYMWHATLYFRCESIQTNSFSAL